MESATQLDGVIIGRFVCLYICIYIYFFC